jgi:hypothetical protein
MSRFGIDCRSVAAAGSPDDIDDCQHFFILGGARGNGP